MDISAHHTVENPQAKATIHLTIDGKTHTATSDDVHQIVKQLQAALDAANAHNSLVALQNSGRSTTPMERHRETLAWHAARQAEQDAAEQAETARKAAEQAEKHRQHWEQQQARQAAGWARRAARIATEQAQA